jgi:hypothetical protein
MGVFQHRIPYEYGEDSSFQNASEFLAILYGILLLLQALPKPLPPIRLHLVGDSKSALSWALKGRIRSEELNHLLGCLFSLLLHNHDLHIISTTWVSSETNTICDVLSRYGDMTTLPLQYSSPSHRMGIAPEIDALFRLCDPMIPRDLMSTEYFVSAWRDISTALLTVTSLTTLPLSPSIYLPPTVSLHYNASTQRYDDIIYVPVHSEAD